METTQIEAKAKEFIDALHALEQGSNDDANQLVALFAPEATLRNAALQNKGVEAKGNDEILQFWVEYKETLGQVETKFHHVTSSPNAAGLFWTTTGRRPEGDDVHYHGSTLLQYNQEGLIEFFRGYYDTRELLVKAE
jgi:hypothetical protein